MTFQGKHFNFLISILQLLFLLHHSLFITLDFTIVGPLQNPGRMLECALACT